MEKISGRQPKFQFSVEQALFDQAEAFCAKTRRGVPETLRAIIEMFFADGDEVASDRLNSGLWDKDKAGASAAKPAAETPEEWAERMVTGKVGKKTHGKAG